MPRKARKKAGARRGIVRRAKVGGGAKQPFSLILNPAELNVLRRLARRDGTSVASVIRQALHTAVFRRHPELAKHALEKEVESFLDSVSSRLPTGPATGARRTRLKNRLITGLMGKQGKG